jgi:AraC-like DNA-binding protein
MPCGGYVGIGTEYRPRIWSTNSAAPGRGFKSWVDIVCAELIELEVRTRNPESFDASLWQLQLGPIQLNHVYTREPQDVRRTREAISRNPKVDFELVYVRTGALVYEHYGKTFAVGQNECVLIDCTEPYSFKSSVCTSGTTLQLPQKWLRFWIAKPEEGVASVIGDTTPWGSAFLATLRALSTQSIENIGPGEMISEQVASLLRLAMSPLADGKGTERSGRRFREIIQLFRNRAHDETLSPDKVATLGGISKRSLHALFAAAGTTFSKELLSIRLERARQYLDDPQSSGIRVSDIGRRCGFVDASHFARRFTERYGISPRAYRSTALSRSFADPSADAQCRSARHPTSPDNRNRSRG